MGGGEQAKKRWQRSILILIQLLVPNPAATLDLTPLKSLTPTNPPNSASSILFLLLWEPQGGVTTNRKHLLKSLSPRWGSFPEVLNARFLLTETNHWFSFLHHSLMLDSHYIPPFGVHPPPKKNLFNSNLHWRMSYWSPLVKFQVSQLRLPEFLCTLTHSKTMQLYFK